MTAFEPIEYFGIGGGQDVAARPAPNRRASSVSLPGWDSHAEGREVEKPAAVPVPSRATRSSPQEDKTDRQQPSSEPQQQQQQSQRRPTAQPTSPSYSFDKLTPESSMVVVGLAEPPSLGETDAFSPAQSPNVSTSPSCCASSAPTSQPLLPLERYLATAERHETILLPPQPANPDLPSSSSSSSSSSSTPPTPTPITHGPADTAQHCPASSATPMNRYLADVLQAHERLALALEGPPVEAGAGAGAAAAAAAGAEHTRPELARGAGPGGEEVAQILPSSSSPHSISLSIGSGGTPAGTRPDEDGGDTADDDDAALDVEALLRKFQEFKRAQALSQPRPRSYKPPRKRRGGSLSHERKKVPRTE